MYIYTSAHFLATKLIFMADAREHRVTIVHSTCDAGASNSFHIFGKVKHANLLNVSKLQKTGLNHRFDVFISAEDAIKDGTKIPTKCRYRMRQCTV